MNSQGHQHYLTQTEIPQGHFLSWELCGSLLSLLEIEYKGWILPYHIFMYIRSQNNHF